MRDAEDAGSLVYLTGESLGVRLILRGTGGGRDGDVVELVGKGGVVGGGGGGDWEGRREGKRVCRVGNGRKWDGPAPS